MLGRLNIFKNIRRSKRPPSRDRLTDLFASKYEKFKELLDSNAELSKIITDMEVKLLGRQLFGMSYLRSQSARAVFYTLRMTQSLNVLSGNRYSALYDRIDAIHSEVRDILSSRREDTVAELVIPYSSVTREMAPLVGGKNANLGEVLNRVGLPVPEGFAITTRAFDLLLSSNELQDEINRLKMEIQPEKPETISRVSEAIQRLIISGKMPDGLASDILCAYDLVRQRTQEVQGEPATCEVSLRSSAIGEDSELSYAGQYLSLLNVPRERLLQSYNYIIASLYTPRAITYRINMGIRDEDVAMSVACIRMIDSVASGVMYTRDPANGSIDVIMISAVWGLGPYAVDGIITPDSYTLAREPELRVLKISISDKPVKLVRDPEGGLFEAQVPPGEQHSPCLSDSQILKLGEYAVKLEEHYGCPQDVEWALDGSGELLVLQARPLQVDTGATCGHHEKAPAVPGYSVLLEGGSTAFPGVAAGSAFIVRSDDDLLEFPHGGILIARHSSPKFMVVMQTARAIITDSGSVTGHMASLSREFRVPTILDMKVATTALQEGTQLTVDATNGRIYQGEVRELLDFEEERRPELADTPVHQTLRQIADLIIPLRLVDPRSSSFAPEYCCSLHDIMRFVHETSYKEMFQISDLVSDAGGCAMKLVAPIPLDLCLIDLGGGVSGADDHSFSVKVDQITSIPFNAVLRGMLREDLRYGRPKPVELSGFFSVMSEQMFSPQVGGAERFGDRSYAIISDRYINFSSRVGYHYCVLDSYCGQTRNKNYISFSFKGGAADEVRRIRRVRSIALILQELDFNVELMGDRVDARLQKYEREITEDRLDQVGRLLQFTRQMDMLMKSEESVTIVAKAFLAGKYHFD